MSRRFAHFNENLKAELGEPLRMGIGIHCGTVILAAFGQQSANVTAIGDAVNTASRLESATKDFSSELVVSQDLLQRSGIVSSAFESHEISVRGRTAPLGIFSAKSAADILAEAQNS